MKQTEGLAPLIRQEIWRSLRSLKQAGLSILVVDKNLADLMSLADRHYIIEKRRHCLARAAQSSFAPIRLFRIGILASKGRVKPL